MKTQAATTPKEDIAEIVTAKIIEKLESGVIPWRKPWRTLAGEGLPRNLVSGKPYRGINVFILACQEFESNYWITYRQAQERGGHIRKGEHGTPVIFWNWIHVEGETPEEERNLPFLRHYVVFNLEQTEGIPFPDPTVPPVETVFTPIEAAEKILVSMPHPPEIRHQGAKAFYRPAVDLVNLPKQTDFAGPEAYYATLFHELAHSTGHSSRLNRKGVMDFNLFGSHEYSQEELVAEMSSAFLCAETGILPAIIDNSAAYIQGWLKQLKNDRHFVIMAAARAQKAFDYILDRKTSAEELKDAA